MIQAGYFYKDLSDPIVTLQTLTSSYHLQPGSADPGHRNPCNAGSAHVQGVEFGYQQRLSYPARRAERQRVISANYSYTTSQANGVDPLRTD